MEKNSKIYVAGHKGLVGSAIVRELQEQGYKNIVSKTSKELDLRDQRQTESFFQSVNPEYVFDAAAKVGGIEANRTQPADFAYNNLQIQNNLIYFAWKNNVKKFLFLASNCIYPRECLQPMKEESLLTGQFEPTNEQYAMAKIAGIKMCQAFRDQYGANFISVIPANQYGPNDNFDLKSSHLIPALIRKFHDAKEQKRSEVTFWGTGTPRREFMYVEDLADASVFLMQNYDSKEPINIGVGKDSPIMEIANSVKETVGFYGLINWDTSKPNGMMRKFLDSSKINNLGWKPKVSLEDGLERTYNWFKQNINLIPK